MTRIYNTTPVITDGLVIYFDPANPKSYVGVGTTTASLIGTPAVVGNLNNNVGFSTDNRGIFNFDGSGTNIITNFNYTELNDFTMSCWFRAAVSEQICGLIGFRGQAPTSGTQAWQQCLLYITGDINAQLPGEYLGFYEFSQRNFAFTGNRITYLLDTIPVTTGEWFNVVATSNSEKTVVYLNTDMIGETINTPRPEKVDPIPFIIGAVGDWRSDNVNNLLPGYEFNGDISAVSIYNRALTQDEVIINYNSLKYRF